ncbi:retrovirus-related pol polyprotein from transposon TNT 1-94 [Tanacetum coccineum]
MMVISQEFPKNTLLYSKQNLKTMNNSVTNAYKFELHFTNTSLDGLKSGNIGDSSCCDDCVTKGGLDQSEHVQAEELGRGHRKKDVSVRLRDYVTNIIHKLSPSHSTPFAQSTSSTEREPVTYFEAVKDKQWRSAMDNKLEALEQNKTWMIQKLPSNKKALGGKWVY